MMYLLSQIDIHWLKNWYTPILGEIVCCVLSTAHIPNIALLVSKLHYLSHNNKHLWFTIKKTKGVNHNIWIQNNNGVVFKQNQYINDGLKER